MKNYRFYVIFALLVLTSTFLVQHRDVSVPVSQPLTDIPLRKAQWHMIRQSQFDERVLAVLKPSDYLSRIYADEQGNRVGLYLGYHGGGPGIGPIHSPKQCLPGSGWNLLSDKTSVVMVDGESVNLVEAIYQNGDARQLFLYWFQVMGKSLDSEYSLKFLEVKNSILHNRRDAAFIRLSIDIGDDLDVALESGRRFVRDFYPSIVAVLPR